MAEVGQGRTLSGDLCITFYFFWNFTSKKERLCKTLACLSVSIVYIFGFVFLLGFLEYVT